MNNVQLHAIITAILLSNSILRVGEVVQGGLHAMNEEDLPRAGCLATEIIVQSRSMLSERAI
jgi:hypothetical protein